MRVGLGFTLLEMLIAVAITSVLATLSYAGFQSSWEKSNFRAMQEFGVELALSQQLHRQRYGRYAQTITATGTPSAKQLIIPSAKKYKITLAATDYFRKYSASVTPLAANASQLPAACRVIVVESDMGIQRFASKSAAGQTTTDECVPHG